MTSLFATFTYSDADAAIEFLTALGFTERIVVRDPDDPATVVHAEFGWGADGGLMFGSARGASEFSARDARGTGRAYLVVAGDADVDATHDRAVAAGGRSLAAPESRDYGGRGATIADPEGNLFSIGSYPGA